MAKSDDNAGAPSFLGMDFISAFVMTVDFTRGLVLLDDARLRAAMAST